MSRRKRMVSLPAPELIDEESTRHLAGRQPEIEEEVERDGHVFLKNILYLLKQSGRKQASVAQAAGVSHDWLRQLTRRGLSQIRQANREPLERLRRFFKLDSVDDFWSETLIAELERVHRRSMAMNPYLRSKDWPYATKVLTLLQTGEHDYLRDLIDTLHRQIKLEGVDERGFHMPD